MQDHHLLENFYVITVISNPIRYTSRYQLYLKFAEQMQKAGVKLITVETSFGDRTHKVTEKTSCEELIEQQKHIQLHSSHEIWHKENMLNIAISRLPSNWKYVAWIDADITFDREDWALETVHQLQHYSIVQMFQSAIDKGPSGEVLQTYHSFGWSYISRQPYPKKNRYYPYWHPGYAWAATKEAINHLGGLIDFAILGSADHHMATSLIGLGQDSVPKGLHPNYLKQVLNWQANAEKYIKRNLGYVPGTILHNWHGKKKDRRYWDRWKILVDHQYDPELDIKKDWQGLYQLTDRSFRFRDDLRSYFRARNEDSIDLS